MSAAPAAQVHLPERASLRLPWSLLPTWLASAALLHFSQDGQHGSLAVAFLPWMAWALLVQTNPHSLARVAALALPLWGIAAGLDAAKGMAAFELLRMGLTLFAAWWLACAAARQARTRVPRAALFALALVSWIVPVLGAENMPEAPLPITVLARLSPLDFALRSQAGWLDCAAPLAGALLVFSIGAFARQGVDLDE